MAVKFKLPKLINAENVPFVKTEKEKKFENEFSPDKEYGKRKVLLTWEAQARAKQKDMSSKVTRTFTIIGIVIGLLLIMMQEYFLILLVGSLLFFVYALSKATPEKVKYEISSHGVKYEETQYYWYQLKNFYFCRISGLDTLCIDTRVGLPGRLYLTLGNNNKGDLKKIIEEYLDYIEEPSKGLLDKAYDSVIDKFNFED